jgi:uncharacterized delta-60 repeat protein
MQKLDLSKILNRLQSLRLHSFLTLFILVGWLLGAVAFGQNNAAGSLDSTFNANGIRIDGYGNGADEIFATAVQTDGKIVVAGKSSFGAFLTAAVARYNPDGTFDTSFNGNGRILLTGIMPAAYAVRIQADGKIVIAGNVAAGQFTDFAVVRLNSNGTLDTTFDGDGKAVTSINTRRDFAYGLEIQPDGKIIAVGASERPDLSGYSEFALARYNTDGSPDTTFGNGGIMTTLNSTSSEAHAVVVQLDGKIVIAGVGSHMAFICRYNADGSPDTNFDTDGITNLQFYLFNSVALQADGKIVAAGGPTVNSIDFTVFRFNANGSLDNTFDGDGIATAPESFATHSASAMVIAANGKITATGGNFTSEFIAVRFNPDGTLDSNFGTGGRAAAFFTGQYGYPNSAALQPDGKLIIAGKVEFNSSFYDFALARFTADGNPDTGFDADGKLTSDIGEATVDTTAVAVQADGKIITAGRHTIPAPVSNNTNFTVFRYNRDGSLDASFDGDGKISLGMFENISDQATSIVVQPDGKILVAGYISNGSFTIYEIFRLNPDGSLDTGFNGSGKVTTDVSPSQDFANSMALQANGKIVVGGYSNTGSASDFSVVRYNSDGSLDTSFNGTGIIVTPVGAAGDQAYSVLAQPDGKIILAGYSIVNDTGNFSAVRYNADGTLDSSFGIGGKVLTLVGTNSSVVFAAALQTDGKILLGGISSGATQDFAVARYNANGTLDSSFGSNGTVITNLGGSARINALIVQPDGKIVATGEAAAPSQSVFDYATVRYNTDGSLDTSFGNAGKVITNVSGIDDRAKAVALDVSAGKIVVAGQAGGLSGVVRYIGGFAANRRTPFDFDGDGKTDISIFRPSVGEWWYLRSSDGGNYAAQFGSSSDKLTPADFTGDGKTDIALFRPSSGEWFILRSEDGSFYSYPFGTSGDIPVTGDFDADGKADSGVFRPSNSTWYIRKSSDGGAIIQQFGQTGDVPVVADYDGDNKADIAIYRVSSGEWWINRSTAGLIAFQFGNSTDKPVQGDFTGDGKADVALFRPSTGEWFVLRSENQSYYSFPFGTNGDTPAPGDYDGDGKFDATVYRSSNTTWYSQRTTAGTLIQSFGQTSDVPVPSAFVP